MFCMKCGKENVEGCRFCVGCGEKMVSLESETTAKPVIQEVTNNFKKDNNVESENYPERVIEKEEKQVLPEKTKSIMETIKGAITNIISIACIMLLAYGGIQKYQSYQAEQKLLKKMYSLAIEEIKSHFDESISNAKFDEFDKKRIVFQEYTYKDLGYGELNYARYGVTVPCQWDTASGHIEGDSTINVYYYTSEQGVLEGVNTSVEDHLYVEDMLQEIYDAYSTGNMEADINASEDVEIALKTLLYEYFTAYYANDTATLQKIAKPFSDNENKFSYLYSNYFQSFENGKFDYYEGVEEGEYVVYASQDIILYDVDTRLPWCCILYVETDSDGSLYINNLYSDYNLNMQECMEDWEQEKYDLMAEYAEYAEIADPYQTILDRMEEVLESDSLLNEKINSLQEEIERDF